MPLDGRQPPSKTEPSAEARTVAGQRSGCNAYGNLGHATPGPQWLVAPTSQRQKLWLAENQSHRDLAVAGRAPVEAVALGRAPSLLENLTRRTDRQRPVRLIRTSR